MTHVIFLYNFLPGVSTEYYVRILIVAILNKIIIIYNIRIIQLHTYTERPRCSGKVSDRNFKGTGFESCLL